MLSLILKPVQKVIDYFRDSEVGGALKEAVRKAMKKKDAGFFEKIKIFYPSDPRWKIESFESWSGTYEALDPLDNKPPFDHDLLLHANGKNPQHTELDLEFKRRILEAKAMLESHVGADLNIIELEKYLENKAPRVTSENERGLFDIYKDSVTGNPTSKIWEDTDSIAKTAGTKRSVQIRLMDQKVNEFLDFVFTAKDPSSGNLRFFIEKPGMWERVKKTYYKIKYKLNI